MKISSDGTDYGNVRIVVKSRTNELDMILNNVTLHNFETVLRSDAATLKLGFYGNAVGIYTTKGATGRNGDYCSSFVQSGIHAGNGGGANIAIVCSGKLNIVCGAQTTRKGGDCDGLGSTGGNGGNGGNGAKAIQADTINVTFTNGKSKSNISIVGGSGGAGGSGGHGRKWYGTKGDYGSNGSGGSSATATNVPINYPAA